MADAVAVATFIEEGGGRGQMQTFGMTPKVLGLGHIDIAGKYQTDGVPLPASISGKLSQLHDVLLVPKDGYFYQYIPSTGKIKMYTPSSAHTHAVVLDTGVSAVPSATETKTGSTTVNLLYGFIAAPTASATKYLGLNGAEGATALVDIPWIIGPVCSVYALRVVVGTAPGAEKEYTLELYINGAASGVTVTLSGTDDSGIWADTPVDLAQGDLLSFKSVNDDGAVANVSYTLLATAATSVDTVPTATHTHGPGTLSDAESASGSATGAAGELADETDLDIEDILFVAIGI